MLSRISSSKLELEKKLYRENHLMHFTLNLQSFKCVNLIAFKNRIYMHEISLRVKVVTYTINCFSPLLHLILRKTD